MRSPPPSVIPSSDLRTPARQHPVCHPFGRTGYGCARGQGSRPPRHLSGRGEGFRLPKRPIRPGLGDGRGQRPAKEGEGDGDRDRAGLVGKLNPTHDQWLRHRLAEKF